MFNTQHMQAGNLKFQIFNTFNVQDGGLISKNLVKPWA